MNLAIAKIKYLLSQKISTYVILAVAIINRIIQLIYFFNLRVDRSHQTLATQNLLHGHGISSMQVFPENISEIVYQPLIKWPPGYSFLLTPFYSLFNNNYITAGVALDILFAIVFIFVSRSILKILQSPVYFINLYTLITGFIIYSFYKKSSSDAIAITLFLTALYFTLQLLKTSQLKAWKLKTTGIITTLLICAFTKYLYMPIVFVIPFFLILSGWVNNNRIVKKAGVLSFSIIAAALTILLLYQKSISGAATYITEPTRGFFSENIFSLFPIIPASFINPDTVFQLMNQQSGINTFTYKIFQLINIIVALLSLVYIFLRLYRLGIRNMSLQNNFLSLFFLITLSITALLITLSLRVAKEDGVWTYVQEPRYFGLPLVLLQLSLVIIFRRKYIISKKISLFASCIIFLLLLTETIRGAYFTTKRIANYKKERYSWQHDLKLQQFVQKIVIKQQEKKPTIPIAFACSSPYIYNRISLYSQIPVMDEIDRINKIESINTKKSSLLLVAIRTDALKDFSPFLSLQEKEDAGYFSGFYFYIIHVEPH